MSPLFSRCRSGQLCPGHVSRACICSAVVSKSMCISNPKLQRKYVKYYVNFTVYIYISIFFMLKYIYIYIYLYMMYIYIYIYIQILCYI